MEAFIGGFLGGIVGLFGMGIGLGINNYFLERRKTAATVAAIEAAQVRVASLIGLAVGQAAETEQTDPAEVN